MADDETPNTNPAPPAGNDPERDFDVDPTEASADAPPSPQEAAAAEAAEAFAQANARRARERLLSERAMREALAPEPPAGPGAPASDAPPAPFAPKPGKQRWPVKTINDPDRGQISFSHNDIVDTTVEDMWLLERPDDMPLTSAVPKYQSNRAEGPETTVWRIRGTIISHKWEKDGDFHLVLQDIGSGYTMVIESPQNGKGSDGKFFVGPNCPPEVRARIAAARTEFEEQLDPAPFFKNTSRRVTVTGVGFFDILHGANGAAETNSIELHPVLDVTFED